jgi:hypothetical protein
VSGSISVSVNSLNDPSADADGTDPDIGNSKAAIVCQRPLADKRIIYEARSWSAGIPGSMSAQRELVDEPD